MTYASTNPYTGEILKTFPTATDQEVRDALDAAGNAYTKWKDSSFADRAKIMKNAAKLLRDNSEDMASILTNEMGKITKEALSEIEVSAEIFEYYAQHTKDLLADRKLPVKSKEEGKPFIAYEPQGIVFIIEPWNFPYYQIARVIAPQLSAGNTVILKHASNVPQCAAAFDDLMLKAGLPHGGFQNLYLARHHTQVVLNDPRVCGVALTGSDEAGSIVSSSAGKALKKATMELGGTDALVILDDADLEKATKWAVYGRHWNAGQVCTSAKRMIVADSLYDKFLELYKEGVNKLKPGDPMDPKTTLGPLCSQKAADRLHEQVERARQEGAHVEEIGPEIPKQGAFFRPTLLSNLEGKDVSHEEFFGPVTQLYRFKTDDEAVKIANDSPYGLGGSVFTKDSERGKAIARRIVTGMVYINHPTMSKADLPFGGVARSGFGRELIDLGLKEFVNQKLIDEVDIDAPF